MVSSKWRTEGISALSQVLLQGILFCQQVFGERVHFSDSQLLLAFVKNMSLLKPSMDPACTEGGFTMWLMLQDTEEASNRMG